MSKLITISKQEVQNEEIQHLAKYISSFSDEEYLWRLSAGETEYKLYSNISHKFNNSIILDIGTRGGNSALALSKNESNKVISYDIVELPAQTELKKENIKFKVKDFTKDSGLDWENIPLIMIDVDPHDGSQERIMFDFLESISWSGIIILDDTRADLWPQIADFVSQIKYVTHDVTDIGHFSGTAIVEFGDKYKVKVID